MTAWQFATILTAHLTAWTLVAWLIDRRAEHRETTRRHLDQHLLHALNEAAHRHQP